MAFPTQSATFVRASSQEATITYNSTLQTSANFTFEAWVKLTSLGTNGELAGWRGQSDGGWVLFLDATDKLTMRYWNAGTVSNTDIKTNAAVFSSTGVWKHIAVSVNGTTGIIVIDGTSVAVTVTGSISCVANSNGTFAIAGNNGYLPGQMSLARYWNTNLSAATILANYCTVLGSTTNLKAEWTLDNVWTDNSGNSNTLTAVSSPTFTSDVTSTCSVASVNSNFFSFM